MVFFASFLASATIAGVILAFTIPTNMSLTQDALENWKNWKNSFIFP
jgi:Na+/H+ antiporter NhaA